MAGRWADEADDMPRERGRWADEDLDEDENEQQFGTFETKPDKDGIKTVTSYITNEKNQTVKIVKRVREVRLKTKENRAVIERRKMKKFGPKVRDGDEEGTVMPAHDDVIIEVPKQTNQVQREENDDDYYFHDLPKREPNMFQRLRKERQEEREREEADQKKDDKAPMENAGADAKKKYVPPSQRAGARTGTTGERDRENDWTLKVSNLSDDVEQEDLHQLFNSVAKVARIYVAKKHSQLRQGQDNKQRQSKGFAFVTFYSKEDAEKAIARLNRHGYDNMILQVEWANKKTNTPAPAK
mmetsp:Transcript_12118/g.23407  ORF Transcript_12118/g.23407 Transcript_12118/m.23407 type:complete len:298 (-) Transcript_12118:628-1521(-)